MSTSPKIILAWEKTPGGVPAVLHSFEPKISRPGSALRNLAIAKMTDVTVISASFGDAAVVFDPWASVLLDSGHNILFHGAYAPSFPIEDHEGHLPHVCLRTCSWERNVDFTQFDQSTNKQDYLSGGKQLSSNIVFAPASSAFLIKTLITRLGNVVAQGVKGKEIERPNAVLRGIAVDCVTDCFSWKFSYSPHSYAAEELEEWVESWREMFKQTFSSVKPSEAPHISYQPSLIERLGSTPDQHENGICGD